MGSYLLFVNRYSDAFIHDSYPPEADKSASGGSISVAELRYHWRYMVLNTNNQ